MLLHTGLWLQWLLCVTGLELLDHPPYSLDLAPCDKQTNKQTNTQTKSLFGWEAVSDRWLGHISSWRLFRGSELELRCRWKKCVDRPYRETIMKINHIILVKFNHCIIVSLWPFQPTFVYCYVDIWTKFSLNKDCWSFLGVGWGPGVGFGL